MRTALIWSYVILFWIKLVAYITFDKAIAVFSTRAVLPMLQQSILANNQSQQQKSENKREVTIIYWLMTSNQLLRVFRVVILISKFLLKTGFNEKYFYFQELKIENWIFNFHFKNWISKTDFYFNIQNLTRE